MDSNIQGGHEPAAPGRKRLTTGSMSLVLLLVHAVVFGWTFASVGNGVDSGLGLAAVFISISFPLVIIAGIMGIFAVVRNEGRVPGVMTLAATVAVILVSIWGFLSTQVF